MKGAADLAEHRDRRRKERAAARALEGSLISLAALLETDVKDLDGHTTGQLREIVVRWTRGTSAVVDNGITPRRYRGERFRAVATVCVVVGLLSAVVLVQTVLGWL